MSTEVLKILMDTLTRGDFDANIDEVLSVAFERKGSSYTALVEKVAEQDEQIAELREASTDVFETWKEVIGIVRDHWVKGEFCLQDGVLCRTSEDYRGHLIYLLSQNLLKYEKENE